MLWREAFQEISGAEDTPKPLSFSMNQYSFPSPARNLAVSKNVIPSLAILRAAATSDSARAVIAPETMPGQSRGYRSSERDKRGRLAGRGVEG